MSLCATNSEVTQVEMARKLSWQHQQASVQCVTRDRKGKVLANAKTAKTLKVFFFLYIYFFYYLEYWKAEGILEYLNFEGVLVYCM